MITTLRNWIIFAVIALAGFIAAMVYRGDCERQSASTLKGWAAKLETAQNEAGALSTLYSEDRLSRARTSAAATRDMLKPLDQWIAAKARLQRAGLVVSDTQAAVANKGGVPIKVTVVLSFAKMTTGDDRLKIITDAVLSMDREFSGCQRFSLTLPTPLNNGGLPQGVYADSSEAVYEFHVLK